MLKRLKSVSMMLFLMGASTGAAYAVSNPGITDVKIAQQDGACTGIVKDATGETVIGASVVVKGTTNGTITGIDGDFSLSNVKKGDILQISFVGYITQEVKWNGTPLNIILKDDTQTLEEADRCSDEYRKLYEAVKGSEIVSHSILDNGVRRVEYDNGITVYVNYSDKECVSDGINISSESFAFSR